MARVSPLKQALRLTIDSTFEDAMARAEDLAHTLELGRVPTERLIECVERKLDIPVLFVDTVNTPEGFSISGATCHLQDLSVILIDRRDTEARLFYDLAHELFHILTWDAMRPDHRESNSFEAQGRAKRIEHLANNFAAALLMPRSPWSNSSTSAARTMQAIWQTLLTNSALRPGHWPGASST